MDKDNDTLTKRARSKYLSDNLTRALLRDNPNSPLTKSYYGSRLCTKYIYQSGKKLNTKYCKQRWCPVCNRIQTAKLISGYVPVLERMNQPYFVTLTKKTVPQEQLEESIALMDSTWRRILHSDAGKRRKINGIRKSECTVRPNNHYHFHYHVIVEGKEAAEWLVDSWLSRLSDVADIKAQDFKPADENSLKEIFKYFTKLLTNNSIGDKEFYSTTSMDVVFQAMKRKRVIQPFGNVKAVKDDIDLSNRVYDLLESGYNTWTWKDNDWYGMDGNPLTGYEPNEKFRQLIDKLNPKKIKPKY